MRGRRKRADIVAGMLEVRILMAWRVVRLDKTPRVELDH